MGQEDNEGYQWSDWGARDFSRHPVLDMAASEKDYQRKVSDGEIRGSAGTVVCTNPLPNFEPNPSHYTRLDPQPIEVCTRWNLPYPLCSAIKYLARAGFKPGETATKDLKKAIAFIDWYIRWLEAQNEQSKKMGGG